MTNWREDGHGRRKRPFGRAELDRFGVWECAKNSVKLAQAHLCTVLRLGRLSASLSSYGSLKSTRRRASAGS
jgi:hypothetical protein